MNTRSLLFLLLASITPPFSVAALLPYAQNSYAQELQAHLAATDRTERMQAETGVEKLFYDVFAYATLPYTQFIRRVLPGECPDLEQLIADLCKQYNIKPPMLFLAHDTNTNHIDIKVCTYNDSSAILMHPGTITALGTRIFQRYVEQVLIRIQTTVDQYKRKLKQVRNTKWIALGIGAGGLTTLAAAAGFKMRNGNTSSSVKPATSAPEASVGSVDTEPAAPSATIPSTPAAVAPSANGINTALLTGAFGVGSAAYGVLLHYLLSKKITGFSFQRISSFHNDEQAREDYFPALKPDKSQIFFTNVDSLFGLDTTIKIQRYLRERNEEFRKLDAAEAEQGRKMLRPSAQSLEIVYDETEEPHKRRLTK